MRWDKNDEHDSRIKAVTDWTSFDEVHTLEARAGVYVFADDSEDVVYIGKAGAGRMIKEDMIIEIMNAKYRNKDEGATQVKALYTNSGDIALALEGDLILKYQPINNDKGILNS